jgi:hypothetical protein
MQSIHSTVYNSAKRFCLLFAAVSILVSSSPLALASTKCVQVGGAYGVCCIGLSAVDGTCCTNVSCSNGQSGSQCSACEDAKMVDPFSKGSGVVELPGIEHIKVNNTVLDLQWS